jgi:hypothetical protein
VYSPDLYETAWRRNGEARRPEIEGAMLNIGQIPTKLFAAPHPQRVVPQLASALSRVYTLDLNKSEVTAVCFDKKAVFVFGGGLLVRYSIVLSDPPIVQKQQTCQITSGVLMMLVSNKKVLTVLASARLLSIEQMSVLSPFPELVKVSSVASSASSLAIVSDDATLNLRSGRLQFAVPFYGDAISCCAISKGYGIAVGGTGSGTIVTCSIFEGTKINVVKLGDGFTPLMTLVTDSWGFIVTFASLKSAGAIAFHLFMHNVNGRLIRSVPLGFAITTWCSVASWKAFDYLIVAGDAGRLYLVEAFYGSLGEPFYQCGATVVAVTYLHKVNAALAVTNNGRAVFVPLLVD